MFYRGEPVELGDITISQNGHWRGKGTSLVRPNTSYQIASKMQPGLDLYDGDIMYPTGDPQMDFERDIWEYNNPVITPKINHSGFKDYLVHQHLPGMNKKKISEIVETAGHGTIMAFVNSGQYNKIAPAPVFLPKTTLDAIRDKFSDYPDQAANYAWLMSRKINHASAAQIVDIEGSEAALRFRTNPYLYLAEVGGLSFKALDDAGKQLSRIPLDDPTRIKAATIAGLGRSESGGNTGIAFTDLVKSVATISGLKGIDINKPLSDMLEHDAYFTHLNHPVTDDNNPNIYVYKTSTVGVERGIASRIASLTDNGLTDQSKEMGAREAQKQKAQFSSRVGAEMTDDQGRALDKCLGSKMCLVTGRPGVGKSALIASLHNGLQSLGCNVMMTAPTGLAANNMHNVVQESRTDLDFNKAQTIHSLLGAQFDGQMKYNGQNKLSYDAYIIDEGSMADNTIMGALLGAIDDNSRVYIVGDPRQLPPVGAGQPFYDMLASQKIPVSQIDQVMRQKADSEIIKAAELIVAGRAPEIKTEEGLDFYFVPTTRGAEKKQLVIDAVRELINEGFDGEHDIHIMAPTNETKLGVSDLNKALRPIMNKNGDETFFIHGKEMAVGDRIIQTKNVKNKDGSIRRSNGEEGILESADIKRGDYIIRFGSDESISREAYSYEDMQNIQPAFVTTVHKKQGKTAKASITLAFNENAKHASRNLIYTGITRGSQKSLLIGDKGAIERAVRVNDTGQRHTTLKSLLRNVDGEQNQTKPERPRKTGSKGIIQSWDDQDVTKPEMLGD